MWRQFPPYRIAFLFLQNSQIYSKADVLGRWQVTGNFNPNASKFKKGKTNKPFVFLKESEITRRPVELENESQKQSFESQ